MIYVGFEIEIEAIQHDESNKRMSDEDINKIMNLAELASNLIGEHNSIKDYHSKSYSNTGWRLEYDCSLHHGAEFISPPEPIDVAIHNLFKFFDYLDESECTTTNSCGLHFNMSSDNMTINKNYVPLIIPFINNRLLFKLWKDRYIGNNNYVIGIQRALNKLSSNIIENYSSFKTTKSTRSNIVPNRTSREINKIVSNISYNLLRNRYNYVNVRENENNRYIEVRIIGGENYHKKRNEIKQTIYHFAKILENILKNPPLLYKKTNKKMISYINRTFEVLERKDALFNPFRCCYLSRLKFESKLLKNIHKYNINELANKIKKECNLNDRKNLKDRECVSQYFIACLLFNPTLWFRNYIGYHIIKYIYNNFGKKYCIRTLKDNIYFKNIRLILPDDEPKTNILWLAEVARHSSIKQKESFVNNLSKDMIEFLLKRRQIGLIRLFKQKIKQSKK